MTKAILLSRNFTNDVSSYWHAFDQESIEDEISYLFDQMRVTRSKMTPQEFKYLQLRAKACINYKDSKQKGNKKDSIKNINNELNNLKARIAFYNGDIWDKKDNNLIDLILQGDGENIEEKILAFQSPRLKYLILRYYFLLNRKKQFDITFAEYAEQQKETRPKKGILTNTLDIGKKLADVLDDVWDAIKGFLPKKIVRIITPFITGIAGFMVHGIEGFKAIKSAYHAYRNEKNPHRKSKILFSVITLMLAGTGIGLSSALLAGTAGFSVMGLSCLPILIPTLITGIYGVKLWKRSYFTSLTKKEVVTAKKAYDDYLSEKRDQFSQLQTKYLAIKERENFLEIKLKRFEKDLSKENIAKYSHYLAEKKSLLAEEINYQTTCSQLQGEIDAKKAIYHAAVKKHTKNKRKLAFGSLEEISSALVLVGTILTFSAVIGLGAVTFGAAPLALIITGVALGAAVEVFEKLDDRKNHLYTKKIENFLSAGWNKICGKKPTIEPTNSQDYDLTQTNSARKIVSPPSIETRNSQDKLVEKKSLLSSFHRRASIANLGHFSKKINPKKESPHTEVMLRKVY